ncbi:MAG: agmatinase [Acetobacteraceae bacterium]|nr:agmatinase [Acetobacteraceae bacterium]
MDPAKLEQLRARFSGAGSADFDDPLGKRIAGKLFVGDRRAFPFEGVATFLSAPYVPDPFAMPASERPQVAMVGVPMDLGVTHRSGTRFGPRAVRAVERIGVLEPALRVAPLVEARFADIGDVPMGSRFFLDACHRDIENFYLRLDKAGMRPLSAGGDHSMTLPILKALGRDRPLGLVHIDAHGDVSGSYEGTTLHHGGPFREAVLAGVLDPERTIQIGLRGGGCWLNEFNLASGMTAIHMHELETMGMAQVIARAREVAKGPIYVTFDIDSIDPGFAPGTGTPEVGGLTPREVLALLRGLVGLDVVAGDVVEVAPQYDASTATAQIAAQMMFQILCLMVKAPSFKGEY